MPMEWRHGVTERFFAAHSLGSAFGKLHARIAKCHVFRVFNRFFAQILGKKYKNAYLCGHLRAHPLLFVP